MEQIVEEKTSIPVGDLQAKEQAQMKTLALTLRVRLLVKTKRLAVARAIRRNRIGLNGTGRPIGSFMFVI